MRLLFLIDAQNIFYALRDTYGPGARLDFKRLLELAKGDKDITYSKQIVYLTQYKDSLAGLITSLKHLGYEIKLSTIVKKGDTLKNTNTDMDLIVDALSLGQSSDVVVVASGDGDYASTYKCLREKGIRVEVMSFQFTLSQKIPNIVDEIIELNDNILMGGKEEK